MPRTVVGANTVAYPLALVVAVTLGVIGAFVAKTTEPSEYAQETCLSGDVACQRDQQSFYDRMISPQQSKERRIPQPGGVTIHYVTIDATQP